MCEVHCKERIQMQYKSNYRNTSPWRKMIIVATLPLIIFIWTTGWILVQIGATTESTETQSKISRIPPKFTTPKKENKKPFCEQEIQA